MFIAQLLTITIPRLLFKCDRCRPWGIMASKLRPVGCVAVKNLLGKSAGLSQQQVRTVVHRSLLRLPENYPQPWDYKTKGFNVSDMFKDRTQDRFHANSKLFVVEGNIGSGKSTLAKELAEQLGMLHMPEFKMDDILIDRYGNDMRKFYHLFPERFRIPDVEMFYKNPMSDMSAVMQERIFSCRFDQYLNALAHIMNTGQGVVLERSPYSDFVFTNAMRAKNFIGPEYFSHYYYQRKRALPELNFWPHLVIYLDAPTNTCLQNIKRRGNKGEIACVDETYLKTMEESYKDSLKEYSRHSKLLAYDWTKPGDADVIVEDIERMDLDFFEWHSGEVFEEWKMLIDEIGWAEARHKVTNKHDARINAFDGIDKFEAGELYISPRDAGHWLHVMKTQVLKSQYGYGYNQHLGDEQAGLGIWRTGQTLPEPWYDYWYKEAYYDQAEAQETSLDFDSDSYDPDYVHHHH